MNIAGKDFNLLYLFTVLYEERSLQRAATRIRLSQPAMSHKLNKLRAEFDDPLFIRTGRGFTPTPKAHQMAKDVCCLVKSLEQFYLRHEAKELNTRVDHIHIYATDFIEWLLLPSLLDRVHEHTPNVKIICHNTVGQLPQAALEQGECDIAIAGFFRKAPEHFYRQPLARFPFKVVCDKEANQQAVPITAEKYAAARHVVSTMTGDLRSPVDEALESHGLNRQVVSGASGFLNLPDTIVGRTLWLTCLAPIADYATQRHPQLLAQDLPFDVPPIQIEQLWHPRTQEDPLRKWIRQQIKEIFSQYE
ncbi:LysR family transcriptional regulator [Alteromonas confluentis]|uniref:LysR family transcriptional regulator n=1 Tax=Alteromonas confluentis TaxID=1656094 RepID=A0A1E7ZCW6_9ALTE|nr:LysR family transcriptional regulator [Alteromonas confluentis]OFC71294.1 LysR family transcriptional regulator [Alteromonas confluentis]